MHIPVLPILLIIAVNGCVDYAIYCRIQNAHKPKWVSKAHLAMVVAIYLVMAAGIVSMLGNLFAGSLLCLMWCIYAFFSIYIPKYLYAIVIGINLLLSKAIRNYSGRYFMAVGASISLLVFAGFWWGAWSARHCVKVERVNISYTNLPKEFDGYRVAQISDLHVGTYGSNTAFVAKVVDRINELHPDIILFTGDIVNQQSSELKPFVSVLSRLKSNDGVYSVLGNHDYGDYRKWDSPLAKSENLEHLKQMQCDMGWQLINNDYVMICRGNDSIALIGVENWGEPPFSRYGDLHKAYYALNDSTFKILMSHNPAHWRAEVLPQSNINLMLSGHTHAMQMMLSVFGHRYSPSSLRYSEWGGLYSEGSDRKLYVNVGVGEVGIPARYGATPEVTLITLSRDETK